jgi:hypothetical protein
MLPSLVAAQCLPWEPENTVGSDSGQIHPPIPQTGREPRADREFHLLAARKLTLVHKSLI